MGRIGQFLTPKRPSWNAEIGPISVIQIPFQHTQGLHIVDLDGFEEKTPFPHSSFLLSLPFLFLA